MLVIRESQQNLFRQTLEEQGLVESLSDTLRESYPHLIEGLHEAQLRERARAAVFRARRYDITSHTSLALFAYFMLWVAPNFDEHPLIRQALLDPEVSPDCRVEALFERVTEIDWAQAAARRDDGAWSAKASGPAPAERARD